jgi:hypothetical protein
MLAPAYRILTSWALLRALLVALSISHAAQAGIGGIGNAEVIEGRFTTHLRNAYIEDGEGPQDNRWRSRIMTDYGVNDWLAAGFYIQGDRRESDNLELEALIGELRFEFTSADTSGFYSGARLRYTWRDGDKKPDDAHIRLILGAPYGRWDFRINQIFGVETGTDARSGLLIETRPQVTYGYYENHRIGIESFSNFGNVSRVDGWNNQSHEVGPVFQGPLTDTLNYEAGYRRGISDAAANHTLRLFLIQSF